MCKIPVCFPPKHTRKSAANQLSTRDSKIKSINLNELIDILVVLAIWREPVLLTWIILLIYLTYTIKYVFFIRVIKNR